MEEFQKYWGVEGRTFMFLIESFIERCPEFRDKEQLAAAIREGLEDLKNGLKRL